jgi:hypothetical protein
MTEKDQFFISRPLLLAALALLASCQPPQWAIDRRERGHERVLAQDGRKQQPKLADGRDAWEFYKPRAALIGANFRRLKSERGEGFQIGPCGAAARIAEDGYFLTASHNLHPNPAAVSLVVSGGKNFLDAPVRVVWNGMPRRDSDTRGRSLDCDVALIHAPLPGAALPLAKADGLSSADCLTLGNFLARPKQNLPVVSLAPSADAGQWRDIAGSQGRFRSVWHRGRILFGDSGGPLANVRGELVGVHFMDAVPWWPLSAQHITYACQVDPDWLRGLIATDREKRSGKAGR